MPISATGKAETAGFTLVELMVVLAIIAIGNVLIWTVPDAGGENPLDQLEEASQQ